MATIVSKKGTTKLYLKGVINGAPREVPLKTDSKSVAKTRAARFEATALLHGYDAALAELNGGKVIKRGCDPTFEEMEGLYRDFLAQSNKRLSPRTIPTNLNNLKRCMTACDAKTIGKIDASKVRKALLPANPTASNLRSFESIIRAAKSVFKRRALTYYKERGFPLFDPFAGMEISAPKVKAYKPVSEVTRESIWEDAPKELAPAPAMIVLLGLAAGMRRSETEAARPNWFSVQSDVCYVSIQAEEEMKIKDRRTGREKTVAAFDTKNHETRVIPITLELWELLEHLRGKTDCSFFVPRGGKRLDDEFRVALAWLRGKGINGEKALHAMRKEAGSIVAKNDGIVAAKNFLGQSDIKVTDTYYAGAMELNPIKRASADPVEAFAKAQGVKVEALRKWLAKQRKATA